MSYVHVSTHISLGAAKGEGERLCRAERSTERVWRLSLGAAPLVSSWAAALRRGENFGSEIHRAASFDIQFISPPHTAPHNRVNWLTLIM